VTAELDLLIIEILESSAIHGDSEIARTQAIKLLLGVKEEEPSAGREFDGLDQAAMPSSRGRTGH
jgi:hypothetical protein